MRAACLTALVALTAAFPASAQFPLSAEIGTSGIAATEARLAALPAPAPDELFALAGLRFLGAIEGALQLRWRKGMSADYSELPIFRLPIPENPAPEPFAPADVTALLTGVSADMTATQDALTRLGPADFALEINLNDLWFDLNTNGTRDEGEAISGVSGLALGRGTGAGNVIVRFDAADAAWLAAYSHFLKAFTSLALAFNPEPAIAKVLDAGVQMQALQGETPPENALDMIFGRQVDRIAMVYFALQQQPDATLTRAAHQSLLDMIAANRRFWALVDLETDNAAEWVPNDRQTSALGLTMPPGTGARWQAVLADAEALLTGAKLMPHWRFGAEAGINLKRRFESPAPVDIPAWAHGAGLLPWAEKGQRITPENWQEFQRLVQGDAMLFAVFLN